MRSITLPFWHSTRHSDGLGSRVSSEAIRRRMVDELFRRHNVRGESRAEIVALLGEPTRMHYCKEFDLVYWLGPERGSISIDSQRLVIKLGPSGRVG
ncbi:MAG TPA: hypothetical protein VH436_16220 [Vicinamibacterales bacterium]